MPFRFFDLPRELQDIILSYTPAVCRFQPVHDQAGLDKDYTPQGIWIRNGKLRSPQAILLRVSHSFTRIVKDIFFSAGNRFIFSGSPDASIAWLTRQSFHHLKQIRKLDLLLEWNDLHAFRGQQLGRNTDGGYEDKEIVLTTQHEQAWVDLVSMISQLFCTSRLHLSIDAAFLNIRLQNSTDEYGDKVEPEGVQGWENDTIRYRCIYWTIFYPFALSRTVFSQLASLHIYLPVHREEESKFEKLIMGSEYDSVQDYDKVKYKRRDSRLPHGFNEWKGFETWYLLSDDEQERIYKSSYNMYDADEEGFMRATILSED